MRVMNNRILSCACAVFLLLLSSLVYSQSNCSDSEKTCVEWKTSWSQETREKIETPEYKSCMKELAAIKISEQCQQDLNDCRTAFQKCVNEKYGGSCILQGGINGTYSCTDCVSALNAQENCIKQNAVKYGYDINQNNWCNSGGTHNTTCDQYLRYNVTPSYDVKECMRYECPQVSGTTDAGSILVPCANKEFRTCDRSNVTKYADVTYIFDRGYNATINESYTFEREECYDIIQEFGGENCSEIINTTRGGITTTTGEPVPVGMKTAQCSRCPSICERKPPVGVTCGRCICPENNGFCDSLGERSNISTISVYCINELWLPQKADNQTCQNNFECLSNFCGKGECYDIRLNVEKQANIIDRILTWIRSLFGLNV